MNVMVTLRTVFVITSLCVSLQVASANPTDFTVRSVTSTNIFKLSDAKGKFVALHFLLKTECPYCLKHTREYAQQSARDARVVQVFLKPDSNEEIKQWAGKLDDDSMKLPIYRDPEASLAKEFGIPDGYKFHGQTVHYPALVILDGSGNEVFRHVGQSNRDRYSYEKFLTKLGELTGTSPR